MRNANRRYSKQEFAKRGDALYEKAVVPNLAPDDDGKFAAIDIESGAYVVSESELEACDELSARLPEAQIWLVRVGHRFVHRFGGREGHDAA